MEKKYLISIVMIFIGIFIAMPNENYAVLQANGNEGAKYTVNDWMVNVRNMEKLGGAMGLSESINEDLTPNGNSNNIDVHMERNSEYGALTILSASSYGNPKKIESGQTTTGNSTGVVMNINSEWVALKAPNGGTTINTAIRYVDLYESDNYSARSGDAISETQSWHGSTNNIWLYGYWWGGPNAGYRTWYPSLLRAHSGSVFSYYGKGALSQNWYDTRNRHCGKESNSL